MQPANFGVLLDSLARAAPDGDRPLPATCARQRHAFIVETPAEAADRAPGNDGRRLESLYLKEALREPAEGDGLLGVHSWVVDELQLKAGMTANELHAVRRRFALAHHPDRAPAAAREAACRRMMIANMLIDEALADRPS
jgi:hypothetical protein